MVKLVVANQEKGDNNNSGSGCSGDADGHGDSTSVNH